MSRKILNTVLDGYKVLSEQGSGSSGTVYQAENIFSKQIFAMKVLSVQTDLAQRELDAVRLYQTIEHPNLIRIHHVGQSDDMLFYTMDWCECSLAQRKVSAEELPAIARKLAGALAELHKHGLVHRDIKPDNILFRNGEVVLGDIGLVTRGETATFAGSPGFLAPVLLNGKTAPNEYTDCYALAKSLYCALSGERPDSFPHYHGTLNNAASLIMRAALAVCSEKPTIRNASELLRFLEREETAIRPRKSRSWLVPAAVIPVLLLAAAGWFFFLQPFGKKETPTPNPIPAAGQEKRRTTSVNQDKDTGKPPIRREIQDAGLIRQREPAVGQKNDEISVRRAWNERNRLSIPRTVSPVQRADLEFEIEWNNLRIDLLERSRDRKITDTEFYREDSNLISLWKTAKWLLKSGASAEKMDLDYGELEEKLTIRDIESHQRWLQLDNEWQNYKANCIRELVRRTKESGQEPRVILREMAKNDAVLRFFGIEQVEYLGKYENIRFSGRQDAKRECDALIAGYLKHREELLREFVPQPIRKSKPTVQ
ncbi:MAG: protein kinase [Lentisphaeria bacterium]|nr:protein kinase [Lentisphaeria bacterium]